MFRVTRLVLGCMNTKNSDEMLSATFCNVRISCWSQVDYQKVEGKKKKREKTKIVEQMPKAPGSEPSHGTDEADKQK